MRYTDWNIEVSKKLHEKYGNDVYTTLKDSNISKSIYDLYKYGKTVDEAVLLYDDIIKNKGNYVSWIA